MILTGKLMRPCANRPRANVRVHVQDNKTALMKAAVNNANDTAQLLIEAGADIDAVDRVRRGFVRGSLFVILVPPLRSVLACSRLC